MTELIDPVPYVPLNRVPLMFVGPYDKATIQASIDGPSTVPGANHVREGIVIKPLHERHAHGLGRVILKLVSNAFLEKDNK